MGITNQKEMVMKTSKSVVIFSAISLFLLMSSVTGYSEDAAAPEAVVDTVVADVLTEVNAVADDAAVVVAPAVEADKAAPAAPEMTEEQKVTMEHMKEFSTINEHHDLLKSLAGTWKTNVKFWMDPAGKPEESEGTSESKIIMGGRFVEQSFTGTAMGQPFEGRGLVGYDNLKKEYTSIWFDNMSTGIMTGAGQYDPAAKTLTAEGSMSCPVTQETHRWYKDVTTFTDEDHYTYESFMRDKDGKEYKAMSITYSKVQP